MKPNWRVVFLVSLVTAGLLWLIVHMHYAENDPDAVYERHKANLKEDDLPKLIRDCSHPPVNAKDYPCINGD